MPEAFTLSDAAKTPDFSRERFAAGFGTLSQVLMGAGIVHGLGIPEPKSVNETTLTAQAATATDPAPANGPLGESVRPAAATPVESIVPQPGGAGTDAAAPAAPEAPEVTQPVAGTTAPESAAAAGLPPLDQLPELPTDKQVKLTDSAGTEVEMPAKEAGELVEQRRNALKNLINCLGT